MMKINDNARVIQGFCRDILQKCKEKKELNNKIKLNNGLVILMKAKFGKEYAFNKKMKKKELNQFCGEGNENNELKFDQSEDINNEKESEQNDDEDSIEAFIKNNLINRTCILKKNEVFI